MLQLLSFSKKTLTNSLSIYVKSNNGNTLSVDLDPKWDIKDVKEFVAPQLGMHAEEMVTIGFSFFCYLIELSAHYIHFS